MIPVVATFDLGAPPRRTGICATCHGPVFGGERGKLRRFCSPECSPPRRRDYVTERAADRARYAARRDAGLCVDCGELSPEGIRCPPHAERLAARRSRT